MIGILKRLTIHLGIRENEYKRPTCTSPLNPDNARISEIWEIIHGARKPDKQSQIQTTQNNARQTMRGGIKKKAHRGRCTLEPASTRQAHQTGTRRKTHKTRRTTQEPPRKKKENDAQQMEQQTKALIQLPHISDRKTTITLRRSREMEERIISSATKKHRHQYPRNLAP